MIDFKPDYNKCRKPQKEVYHNVCRHIVKRTCMYCGDSSNKCIAWSGYRHEETITAKPVKKIKLKRRAK